MRDLKDLVGATILAVDSVVDETCNRWESWPVLSVRLKSGETRTLWIGRDPEGNGPGWIDICEGND